MSIPRTAISNTCRCDHPACKACRDRRAAIKALPDMTAKANVTIDTSREAYGMFPGDEYQR